MNVKQTKLPGVVTIEPTLFEDGRGWFREVFSERKTSENLFDDAEVAGRFGGFVQENESFSKYGVIRGLHYQLPPKAQGKLVRVASGHILDVAVDLRAGSPTFGMHASVELSECDMRMLWIPRGFAHGFSTLSQTAKVIYLCDEFYEPVYERSIIYNDRRLNIEWRVPATEIRVSAKDRQAVGFASAELFDYNESLY